MKLDTQYEFLGYANEWVFPPVIVKDCQKKAHERETRTEGRCLTRYICHECKYSYLIDSGD